jgi:hypothetical protein
LLSVLAVLPVADGAGRANPLALPTLLTVLAVLTR